MRFIVFISFSIVLSFFFFILNSSSVYSAPACNGTFQCIQETYNCSTSSGSSCARGTDGCTCTQTNVTITEQCSFLLTQGACDGGTANAVCTTIYAPSAGIQNYNCSLQNDACTVNSDCGSNRRCCGGTPNYCSANCYDCAGNYICAVATATPTPTPATGCAAWIGGWTACNDWCKTAAAGYRDGCNADCLTCYDDATSTPTPTTGVQPTSPPTTGGETGFACANSAGTPFSACQTASTCQYVCLDAGWASCATCEMPPEDVGGCMENGGSCNDHITGVSTCCSGYCNYGTCETVPTCSGCTFWNGSYCQDSNSLCSSGQTCSGGVCINPTYTISGRVFIDTNTDGFRNSGESGYQNVTVSLSNGANRTTGSDGLYSFTNLPAFRYRVTLGMPDGYVVSHVSLPNPRENVDVGPDQTINFGIVQVPPDCPGGISPASATVNGGQSIDLTLSGCTNVENPPDNNLPPPFDWDPPKDDNPSGPGDPECNDLIDNDGDGLNNANDPGCHWDGDSTNPGSYRPNDDNEANVYPPRQCNDLRDNDNDGFTDSEDPNCHTDLNPNNPGSYNPNIDNESDRLSPGHSGSTVCVDAELVVLSWNETSTSSLATWTAPQCPTSTLTCTVTATVNGPGGVTSPPYSRNITVNRTGQIDVDIRDVSEGEPCNASAPLYTAPVTVGLEGPVVNTIETINDGTYSFVCLPNGNYNVSLGLPPGYQMIEPASRDITRTVTNNTQSARFCIGNFEPWYQTTQGDVRMRGIVNPIPGGQLGSVGENIQNPGLALYPSVFFSTQYSAVVDAGGGLSAKNWLVNREYEYNSLTRNRNGIVAYSFYKNRARQEGIEITPLEEAILNPGEIEESGVYEYEGDVLTINSYSQIPDRAVILVNGDVIINTEIEIDESKLFILAASGNITIASTVGHATPGFNTTESNLEGIYSAQGDIILAGGDCAGGVPDRRLNIEGALIANAQKPFASDGGGAVQNQRSLCMDDDFYPSLYVSSRPDFLTKLTDFYKVSYTKWREVRP